MFKNKDNLFFSCLFDGLFVIILSSKRGGIRGENVRGDHIFPAASTGDVHQIGIFINHIVEFFQVTVISSEFQQVNTKFEITTLNGTPWIAFQVAVVVLFSLFFFFTTIILILSDKRSKLVPRNWDLAAKRLREILRTAVVFRTPPTVDSVLEILVGRLVNVSNYTVSTTK